MNDDKAALLALPVGGNYAVYVRLPRPYGPHEYGEITTWEGATLGLLVPSTVREVVSSGFKGVPTKRYYYRAVVKDEETGHSVLLAGQVANDGMLSNVKRMLDRDHPAFKEAPHPKSARGKEVRKGVPRTVRRPKKMLAENFDYEDSGEL